RTPTCPQPSWAPPGPSRCATTSRQPACGSTTTCWPGSTRRWGRSSRPTPTRRGRRTGSRPSADVTGHGRLATVGAVTTTSPLIDPHDLQAALDGPDGERPVLLDVRYRLDEPDGQAFHEESHLP